MCIHTHLIHRNNTLHPQHQFLSLKVQTQFRLCFYCPHLLFGNVQEIYWFLALVQRNITFRWSRHTFAFFQLSCVIESFGSLFYIACLSRGFLRNSVGEFYGTDYKGCLCQSPGLTHESTHWNSNRHLLDGGKNVLWGRKLMCNESAQKYQLRRARLGLHSLRVFCIVLVSIAKCM